MKLLFNIANQQINQVNSQCVVSDSVNYLYAQFFFSDDWDGFEKTAVFTGSDSAYTALLNDGGCTVPHEIITAGRFSVSVFGIRGDVRITTDTVYITVQRSGYRDGETPKPPTPTVYEQILGRIAGADNAIAAETQQRTAADDEIMRRVAAADNAIVAESQQRVTADDEILQRVTAADSAIAAEVQQRETADNEIMQQLTAETAERKTAVALEEQARCDDVNALSEKINSLSEKADEFAEDYVSKSGIYQTSNGQTDVLWQEIVDEVAKIHQILDNIVELRGSDPTVGFFLQELVDEVAKINPALIQIDEIANDYVSKIGYYKVYNKHPSGIDGFLWQEIVEEVAEISSKISTHEKVSTDSDLTCREAIGKIPEILNNVDLLVDLAGDCEILPVAEGVTEKIVIKRAWAADKYCVYAGDTPFTSESISVTEPTVTAKGGFEGGNITVRLYTADGVQISVVKLNIIEISGRKIGRMERI